jgi:hypothetical protein
MQKYDLVSEPNQPAAAEFWTYAGQTSAANLGTA